MEKEVLSNNSYKNGPLVLFEDFALFIRIGQSLEILSGQQIQEYNQMLALLLNQ